MSESSKSTVRRYRVNRRRNEAVLAPVRPNAGIAACYRAKIMRLVEEMARSYTYWLKAAYRADPPVMAQDATPAAEIQKSLRQLGLQWEKRFSTAAPELADYFKQSVSKRSDASLRAILKNAGITVKFKMTAPMRDVLQATLGENVSLIKSIASQYHTEVEGLVMRSVTAGRDLGFLTKELQKRYGVTHRRAAFIAQSQNNMATAALTRVRQSDLGIKESIWMHSHGGKVPRPTHLANDRKRYNVDEGWFDPDPKVRRFIWPGELPRCRCVSGAVVKGFS